MALRSKLAVCVTALATSATLLGCTQYDMVRLAGDDTAGRNNGTPGSALARQFLIDELKPISNGLNTAATGDAAYTQTMPNGTNVVAVIPGTDLANEYVVVGGHYDHLGSSCQSKEAGDTICNGATDNAAGAAAVLSTARSQPRAPSRAAPSCSPSGTRRRTDSSARATTSITHWCRSRRRSATST